MIVKTKGIVLQAIKHNDTSIVVHIFTREYGLLAFIIQGVHSRKSGRKNVYFQPLQVLALEVYYKQGNNLHSVKEVSPVYHHSRISGDLARSSIAFFMGEVIKKSLAENDPNISLWDFVYESILLLDQSEQIANFHVAFLVRFSVFLGITPEQSRKPENAYFDMMNGVFVSSPPLHGYYFDHNSSEILYMFINSTIQESSAIKLNGSSRSVFLELMLNYYSMHLEGMKKIKSLEVLKEVFG